MPQDELRAMGEYPLFEEDFATLRDNYVHHWGTLYVAGKRLALSAEPMSFEILIPGRYTLESAGEVLIDGQSYPAGSTLALTAGAHTIEGLEVGLGEVVLRWGEDLYRPAAPPPPGWIFAGF